METQNQPSLVSEATKGTTTTTLLPQWPPNKSSPIPIPPPPPPPPSHVLLTTPQKVGRTVGRLDRFYHHRPLGETRSCPPRPQWPPSTPTMSQQQAEARHMVLNEIKELQLRRQSSFKRAIMRLPMWGSG